jgi:8-oxo-dGTP pyrophosphatase MutT (NUDIX family)
LYTRATLINSIASSSEACRLAFLDLLSHADSFQRYHLPGHITGSAWIVNQDLTKVLLVLHAKLGRWLQPGGHADGEEDVLRVALREVGEETGIVHFVKIDPAVFDLDIHPIPARKEMPEHFHYDVRFMMIADDSVPLQISDESRDLRWVDLASVGVLTGNNSSIMRMVDKTVTLRLTQQQ